jgi:hypothetical protein
MPKPNITRQTVLLTSRQAVTFEATKENTDPVAVSWTLSSSIGSFAPPEAVNKPVPSATYVAPMIASAQTITVIAVNPEDHNNSASATISLTSDAIALVSRQSRTDGSAFPAVHRSYYWLFDPPLRVGCCRVHCSACDATSQEIQHLMLNSAAERPLDRGLQSVEISLVHGNEAEWLQTHRSIETGVKQFRQTENWPTLRPKHQFHDCTGHEGFEHAQQTASYGNGLKLGGRALPILQSQARGWHPGKPHTRSTSLGWSLGGETHGAKYATEYVGKRDYEGVRRPGVGMCMARRYITLASKGPRHRQSLIHFVPTSGQANYAANLFFHHAFIAQLGYRYPGRRRIHSVLR